MANSTTQFGGFLTDVGVAQQANTAALGLPWNITHMLLGDAGGDPSQTPDPTPKPTQSTLVRQVYRAPLNALYPSPADPNVLVAELVLPPEIGGWWIRELALEDASGNFIAVAMPAPSYKPLLAQGSGRTQTIRMHVVFGNLANVTLKVDPSIVLATRDYADKAREAAELYTRNQLKAHVEATAPHPQYLRRADVAKDAGQLAWLGSATGSANALVLKLKSSEATLAAYAAGQRFQFQASVANTGAVTARINGLAVVAVKKAGASGLVDLVAGDIRAGALYDLNYDGTYFQLGGGVGAGKAFERFSFEASVGQTTFTAPHTIGSTVVLRNGREVTDYQADGQKIIFRTACAVGDSVEILAFSGFQVADTYTKAEVKALIDVASGLPVGTMLAFPRGTVPAGFLEVDGSTKSAAVYPDLAAYLGTAFNTGGEAAGEFRLPESRGEFLRGWDNTRGVDPGRAVGSYQADEFKSHYHTVDNVANSGSDPTKWAYGDPGSANSMQPDSVRTNVAGGAETRPRNLAVLWCIKAWNAPVNQGNIDVAALAAQVAVAVPKGYRTGLGMAVNSTAPATTIDILPGLARTSGMPVELGNAMSGVLQATGPWSAGYGGNKLDVGARAINSWYHVFLLRNVSTNQADMLFSLSVATPSVPAGYDLVRRLGSIRTNASAAILPFTNLGRHFLWQTPPLDVSLTSTVVNAVYVVSVPPGVRVMGRLGVFNSGGDSYWACTPTDGAELNPRFSNWTGGNSVTTNSTADYGAAESVVLTDESGSVRFSSGGYGASVFKVVTYGWEEF